MRFIKLLLKLWFLLSLTASPSILMFFFLFLFRPFYNDHWISAYSFCPSVNPYYFVLRYLLMLSSLFSFQTGVRWSLFHVCSCHRDWQVTFYSQAWTYRQTFNCRVGASRAGVRGHCSVYYTSPKSFIFHSLAHQLWRLSFNFDWLVH